MCLGALVGVAIATTAGVATIVCVIFIALILV